MDAPNYVKREVFYETLDAVTLSNRAASGRLAGIVRAAWTRARRGSQQVAVAVAVAQRRGAVAAPCTVAASFFGGREDAGNLDT